MTDEQQLKLQAFLDGELPEKEAREVAAWVARDAEAANLVKELKHTRAALAGFEPALRVPETREFYWSKIEREIRSLEPTPAEKTSSSLAAWMRRLLMPAGAVAALLLVATIIGVEFGVLRSPRRPETEMASSDSGTFTYHDDASGTTLVWLNYPAER